MTKYWYDEPQLHDVTIVIGSVRYTDSGVPYATSFIQRMDVELNGLEGIKEFIRYIEAYPKVAESHQAT